MKRRSRLAMALGSLLGAAAVVTVGAPPAAADHGHLKVYAFVLDGLDGDALSEGSAPFISSLIRGEKGASTTYYPDSRSVMVAETNPNHTAMITGAYPESSGIVGNEFAVYGEPPDEDSCPAKLDPAGQPFATSGESTGCVKVPNLFETVERRKQSQHITTALIMGKPKLARLFATRNTGNDGYDADFVWAPCDDDEPYCEDVPTNPATGYALNDEIVMDEVIDTANRGVIDEGRRRTPDFTFANFPLIDSAGHASGRSSPLYDDAVALADAQIRRFVDNQKEQGLWSRTVLMIVSDHSMDDTPQINKISLADALEAGGVPASKFEVVGNGNAAHVYLTARKAADADETVKKMRETLLGLPGVVNALYRRPNPVDGGKQHTIAKQRPGWGLGGPRTGDLVVTTALGVGVLDTSEANSLPLNPLPGNHGSPLTRDNTFLITGGSPVLRQGESDAPAINTDVNPTAMRLLNRKPAKTVEGNFRRDAFKAKLLPKRGGKKK